MRNLANVLESLSRLTYIFTNIQTFQIIAFCSTTNELQIVMFPFLSCCQFGKSCQFRLVGKSLLSRSGILPPASAVEAIETVSSVCVCVSFECQLALSQLNRLMQDLTMSCDVTEDVRRQAVGGAASCLIIDTIISTGYSLPVCHQPITYAPHGDS